MNPEYSTTPMAIRCHDLTLDTLQSDYEFYCNSFVGENEIWWTKVGGSYGGGPLDNFLSTLSLDGDYAFGPPKKQKGWTLERLAEKRAVGVYRMKTSRSADKHTKGS